MSAPLKRLLLALLVATIAFSLGCGGFGNASDTSATVVDGETLESDSDEQAADPIPVEVAELTLGPIESVLEATAHLEAENSVQVFSQTKGLITRLYVEEGDRVRRGSMLLKLEDDEQRNALASVKVQLAKAQREYERQKRLFAQQLISEQAFNEATFEIERLELALTDAELQLKYTEVRAPIAGTVTQRMINRGDRLQPGQHLFDIVDFDSLVAKIFVPEKELARLRPGLKARISSQARSEQQYEGRLDRIAPVVDTRSGTVKATIDIGRQGGLMPGMYVNVRLITDVRDRALLVPKRALVYDADQLFVFRVGEGDRAERVQLVPQLENDQYVQPLGDALEEGELVVVAGQAALKNDALVRRIDVAATAEIGATEESGKPASES